MSDNKPPLGGERLEDERLQLDGVVILYVLVMVVAYLTCWRFLL